MNRNTKKGFTIVELIIVIAVIAVLAAVLIPTFSNLIGKAQEAKDTALVRNLNEALAMDTTTSKHLTMSDAVAAVRNNGIDISKIKATVPGNAILWDSVNDLFAYYKVDKEGNSGDKVYYIPEYSADAPADGRLFAVVSDSNAIATSKYGVYYTGSNVDSVTVNGVGFDAGSAQIGTVVYNGSTSGATVDIRTNGGALTIKNAGNDDINHHNSVMSVVIEEVKGSSYHEYGTVQGNIEVKKGHVVLEKGASVGTIVVNPTDNATVSVSTNGGSAGAVVKKEGVTATIDSTLPTTTITGDQEEEMKLFAGGIGTETSPYLIETVEQFVNIGELATEMAEGNAYHFRLVADIDLRTYNGEFNEFGKENLKAVTGYFKGALDGAKTEGGNHKLIANDELNYVFVAAKDSASFSNIDYYFVDTLVKLCPGQSGNSSVTFDNVDSYQVDSTASLSLVSNQGLYTDWVDLDKMRGDYWTQNTDITVKNADVHVNIVATGYNAVFFGGCPNQSGTATVENSYYYGNYYGDHVNLVLGNLSGNGYSVIVKNVANKGLLAATIAAPMVAGGKYTANSVECTSGTYTNVNLGTSRWLSDTGLGITINEDGLKIKEAISQSTDYYVLTISGGKRRVSVTSENSTYTFGVKITKDLFENQYYQTNYKDGKLATVAQYKEFVDANATFKTSESIKIITESNVEFWMVENKGTLYYVFDFHNQEFYFMNGSNESAIVDVNSAMITAYDKEGLPIAQKDIKL